MSVEPQQEPMLESGWFEIISKLMSCKILTVVEIRIIYMYIGLVDFVVVQKTNISPFVLKTK